MALLGILKHLHVLTYGLVLSILYQELIQKCKLYYLNMLFTQVCCKLYARRLAMINISNFLKLLHDFFIRYAFKLMVKK